MENVLNSVKIKIILTVTSKLYKIHFIEFQLLNTFFKPSFQPTIKFVNFSFKYLNKVTCSTLFKAWGN